MSDDIRERVSDQFPDIGRGGVPVSLEQGRLSLGQRSRGPQHTQRETIGWCGTAQESKTMCSRYLRGFGIGECPEPEQWGPSLLLCLSPERSEGLDIWGTCPPMRSPCLVWSLSLVLLIGMSACGPGAPDRSPSLESRASLSGASTSHSVPQNSPSSMTEWRQEETSGTVVVSKDQNDDTSIDRNSGKLAYETERMEDETEQEESSGKQSER